MAKTKLIKEGRLTTPQMDSLLTSIKKCNDLRQLKKIMKYAAKRIDIVKLSKTSVRKFKPTTPKNQVTPRGYYNGYGGYGSGNRGYSYGGPVI